VKKVLDIYKKRLHYEHCTGVNTILRGYRVRL
jgi:hypothetical protein